MYNIFPQTTARHADELSDDDLEVLLFIIAQSFKAPLASSPRSPAGSPRRSNHPQENL